MLSRFSFAIIAFLRPGVPSTAVYLVKPLLIAVIAASLMCCGVSKSGSPAPNPITFLPAAFNSAALLVTASVGDGLMAFTRSERRTSTALFLLIGIKKIKSTLS
ncbi:hypothetical protein D3C75_1161570 [compost metagenome]